MEKVIHDGIEARVEQVMLEVDSEIRSIRKSMYDTNGMILKSESFVETYHGKIDWDVAKRILQVIYYESPIRRTRFAMKSGLNYGAGTRYATWMEELGWITISQFSNLIRLSELGMKMCERLAFHKSTNSDIYRLAVRMP